MFLSVTIHHSEEWRKESTMTCKLASDTELLEFWTAEGISLAEDLLLYIKGTSTKISNISKKDTAFYLYLNWRQMSGTDWVLLRIAIHFLEDSPLGIQCQKDELCRYVLRELKLALARNQNRMKNTKFNQLEMALSATAEIHSLGSHLKSAFPSKREWEGNYKKRLLKILTKILSVRLQTPRRIERQQRVRGYRDHGSMASIHEKARREANTSGWNEFLEQARYLIEVEDYTLEDALKSVFGRIVNKRE